jgi:carbamoyl-phosphate synthase small subunit
MKAILALESGRIFRGNSFGAEGEASGEVVFNTSMAGYQEILTDPSYEGQIITMTSVQIGNYGVNEEDAESRKPFGAGFVVREISGLYSNWRAKESLQAYFQRYGLVGIADIDTRALTKHLRDMGSLRGVVSTTESNPDVLIAKAKASPNMAGQDLAKLVSCEKPYLWAHDGEKWTRTTIEEAPALKGSQTRRVVVLDFGVKFNTLRMLAERGCQVIVVPATTTADEMLAFQPDGVLVSNGPGDPSAVTYGIQNLKTLIERISKAPSSRRTALMGICLGHQLLGLALGGKTFKLKFGHRGGNHPVKDLTTGKIEITSQNHGFAIDADSLKGKDVELTHLNLNDNTCEGLRHKALPIFAVQYHPEAAPGPTDSAYLFDRFLESMPGATHA